MVEPLHIVVVGGSIGGLTAACLLRDSGHDVLIYERSAVELQQRGAGIGFLPATYRYLKDRAGLDLASAVCKPISFAISMGRAMLRMSFLTRIFLVLGTRSTQICSINLSPKNMY